MPFPKCLQVRMVNTDQYVQQLDWINEPSTCISKILNTFFLSFNFITNLMHLFN